MSDAEGVIDADTIKDKLDALLEAVERLEGRLEAIQASLEALTSKEEPNERR